MAEEDKEFFVLVLGVLAAILLVISWWFTTGGTGYATTAVSSTAATTAVDDDHADDHGEDDADDHDGDGADDHDGDGDASTAEAPDAADAADADSAAATTEADPPPPADSSTEDTADEDAPAAPVAATVFDAIADDPNLGVVTGLLRSTGLDAALSADGPFTVFAPSDDAINLAAGSDATVAVLETNPTNILSYHVVDGEYTIDDLADIARGSRSPVLTTVQGESIRLTLDGTSVVINGNAVIAGDAAASGNGTVHTLDNVLVPPVAALNTLVGSEPILFATGSATIEEASIPTLNRFIEVLSNSDASVKIEGHTDSSGDPIVNQDLSQQRARSVLNYLVAKRRR